MEQQTLATVLTGIGVAIALVTYLRSMKKDLMAQTEKVESNLGARIDKVETGLIDTRSELGARIDKVAENLTDTRNELVAHSNQVETNLGTRIDKVDQKLDDCFEKLDARLTETRNEHRGELSDIRAGLRALEQRFFEILLPRHPAPTGTDDA